MLVMIDNQDSFIYNLVDLIQQHLGASIQVISSTEANVEQLEALNPTGLIISPGPGRPEDYPQLYDIFQRYETEIPILGVCLGFQFMIAYYGGRIIHSDRPVHGHTTAITHDNEGLFEQLSQGFHVMRYHSLMAGDVTEPLKVCATNEDGIPMGVMHQSLPIYGVQYHPESILSEYGRAQIQLFLEKVGERHANPI